MSITPAKTTMYVCDNCPTKPTFTTPEALYDHWHLTHTVPMVETQLDPWGERPARTRKLWHTETVTV